MTTITRHDPEADDHVQRVQAGHARSTARRTCSAAVRIVGLVPDGSAGPGTRWCSNLSVVLDRLDAEEGGAEQDRENEEQHLVLRDPLVCAARTASAIVSELQISTAVLMAPSMTFSCVAASANASGDSVAVDDVRHEQAAEEHDFGDEEHPHAERRRLGLLLHAVEVVLQLRMVRVPCGVATGGR